MGISLRGTTRLKDSHFCARAGHAINGAGGFILADGESTLAVDGLHSQGAIRAHAGQDDAHGERAKDFGNGKHHDVDGRNVDDVAGSRRDLQNDLGGRAAANGEVLSGGSHIDVAAGEHHAFFGLMHMDVAEVVEALGEWTGESWRHVLHDQDADGQVGG